MGLVLIIKLVLVSLAGSYFSGIFNAMQSLSGTIEEKLLEKNKKMFVRFVNVP